MPFVMLIAAIVGGVIAVGALLLLQSVVQAFHPGWTLPFSAWWGLLLSVPALFAALLQGLRGIDRRTP